MPTIIIQREDALIGRLRNFKIYVDGLQVGKIANEQSLEFHVSAGRHTLKSTYDYYCSPLVSIEINENETKTFRLTSSKNGVKILVIGMVLITPYFLLNPEMVFNWTVVFLFAAITVVALDIILGRKKYLKLEEI